MRIGVVAPSNRLPPDLPGRLYAHCAEAYGAAAPEIRFHPQCFEACGHFAGPDQLRATAFVDMANDPDIDAVWFGRGGYGSFRLIPQVLAGLGPAARDKLYLGYSDGGALLGALYTAGIGRVAHGPMPNDLGRPDGGRAVGRALDFMTGRGNAALEPSLGGLPAAAFNITILAHLVGTPWLPDLTGHILMIEDVAEPMYRIDRCLGQILSAPGLGRPAGVRLGRCSDIVANDPDFVLDEEQVTRFWCDRAGIPYLGRADIGHDMDNKVVPFGTWRLETAPPIG